MALQYRPTEIIVHLNAETADINKTAVAASPDWTWKFEDLQKYTAEGVEIRYDVYEEPIINYTSTVQETGENQYEIKNTYHEGFMDIPVSKEWLDDDNRDGLRPDKITVELQPSEKTAELPQNGKWEYTFTDLPVYDGSGKEIEYSIREVRVDGYDSVIEGTYKTGFIVKNTHEPAKTEVSIHKVWDDMENRYELRPSALNFLNSLTLMGDGVPYVFNNLRLVSETGDSSVYSVDASAGSVSIVIEIVIDDDWNVKITNLPKYDLNTHQELEWTVDELLEHYLPILDGNMKDGITLTNKLDYTSLTLTKVWDDNSNAEGKRPEPMIFLQGLELFANNDLWSVGTYEFVSLQGTEWTFRTAGGNAEIVVTLRETDQNTWKVTLDKLPRFLNGTEIIWNVKENVYGYRTNVTGNGTGDIVITNQFDLVTISGSKTWNYTSAEGVIAPEDKRPQQIIVNLYANGVKTNEMTASADNNWSWTFTDLKKYDDQGSLIQYTVDERPIRDYDTVTTGYDITNTYAPNLRNLPVYKSWDDDGNRDGLRGDSVRVFLLADGVRIDEAVLDESNQWRHEFRQLDIYAEDNVTEIVYTVEEDPDTIPAGYSVKINGNMDEGYEIINSHTPETTRIDGTKRWNDRGNEGARPEFITVRLHANGEEKQNTTASENTGWAWSFENLPVKDHGVNIVYTVTEDRIDNYVTSINPDTFEITNTYDAGKTSITVSKVWDDNDNADGYRPESVTVILLENGEYLGKSIELNEGNHWTGIFSDLDETRHGKPIQYTVAEQNASVLYRISVGGSADRGYTITNQLVNEITEIDVRKVWVDEDNKYHKRPASVNIKLLADGIDTGKSLVLSEENGWWVSSGYTSGLPGKGTAEDRYNRQRVPAFTKTGFCPLHTGQYGTDDPES